MPRRLLWVNTLCLLGLLTSLFFFRDEWIVELHRLRSDNLQKVAKIEQLQLELSDSEKRALETKAQLEQQINALETDLSAEKQRTADLRKRVNDLILKAKEAQKKLISGQKRAERAEASYRRVVASLNNRTLTLKETQKALVALQEQHEETVASNNALNSALFEAKDTAFNLLHMQNRLYELKSESRRFKKQVEDL